MTYGWGSHASVEQWLRAEPQRFEFPQAVRLLEAIAGAGAARLRAHGSQAFPPSEVASLDGRTLTVPLLALSGALGPLPAGFTEGRERDAALAEFLDIFHQRLLWLLYRVLRMPAPALGGAQDDHGLRRALFAVAGLGTEGVRGRMNVPDAALPRYAAWLGRETRPAQGLEAILGDYLGVTVTVAQFQGRWARLDARQWTRLGRPESPRLGQGAVLGRRAWDDHAGVEIRLGPLDAEMFASLLPGGRRAAAVRDLVRLYLRDPYRVSWRLVVAAGAVRAGRLGGTRLGYTSFLSARAARGPAEVRVSAERQP